MPSWLAPGLVWCPVLLFGLGFVREILLEEYGEDGEDGGCTMLSCFLALLACFLDLVREHHRKSFEEVNIYDYLFFSFG